MKRNTHCIIRSTHTFSWTQWNMEYISYFSFNITLSVCVTLHAFNKIKYVILCLSALNVLYVQNTFASVGLARPLIFTHFLAIQKSSQIVCVSVFTWCKWLWQPDGEWRGWETKDLGSALPDSRLLPCCEQSQKQPCH